MVPAGEATALEVVEAELALEILVSTLGAPAFLDETNELFAIHDRRCGAEVEVGGPLLAIAPFEDKRDTLALGGGRAVVVRRDDLADAEAR